MSPLMGIILLLVILAIAAVVLRTPSSPTGGDSGMGADDEMLAAPPEDGEHVADCTTRFYTQPNAEGRTVYCIRDGTRPPRCESQPLAAIVAVNEDSSTTRCSHVSWGFGCDKGLLCGLQQAGPNLASYATADKIGRVQCGGRQRLSC